MVFVLFKGPKVVTLPFGCLAVVCTGSHVAAATNTFCLVYIDDVTAVKGSRMSSEVFWAMSSVSERSMQMDNDPKHKAKATSVFLFFLKEEDMQLSSQSPDLNPSDHAFCSKGEKKRPKTKRERETPTLEAWQCYRG